MAPKVLQPEILPYASVEIARLTDSTPPLHEQICAWCPDFNPKAVQHKGASHGICPACRARFEQEVA